MQFALKVITFLSAYAPLFVIYAIRALPQNWKASAVLGAASIVFPAIVLAYVARAKDANPERTVVADVLRRDDQVMAYLFTYVLPFVGLTFTDAYEVAASAVFLALLFVLYIRTNLFYVNPILGAAGYRVYEVQVQGAPPRVVLSKERFVAVGQALKLVRLADEDIYLHVRSKP